MKLKNIVGYEIDKKYVCIYLFPFGIELYLEDTINISFILYKYQLSLVLEKNYTIFNQENLVKKAMELRNSLNKTKD